MRDEIKIHQLLKMPLGEQIVGIQPCRDGFIVATHETIYYLSVGYFEETELSPLRATDVLR